MHIGILGGTFNPIHYGHLRLAKRVRRAFSLDGCVLMVANDPPHKDVSGNVSAQTRFEMAKLAVEADGCSNYIAASDLEIRLGGTSYTANTLQAVHDMYPDVHPTLIVGADMLYDIPNWRSPETIFKLADMIAIQRKSKGESRQALTRLKLMARELHNAYGAKIHVADLSIPNISSSNIRDRVYNAGSISGHTPYEVERVIYENALYQTDLVTRIIADLEKRLSKKRLIHSISTMREAIELADMYNADRDKCRLAALLHDCAKINDTDYIKAAQEVGIEVDKYELEFPALLHAKLGAYNARHLYGIDDREIALAIESHTLCRRGMSDVEKIVYIADKIEPLRSYPGVEGLRAASRRGLNTGLLACMDFSIAHLRETKDSIHPGILEAREYLVREH